MKRGQRFNSEGNSPDLALTNGNFDKNSGHITFTVANIGSQDATGWQNKDWIRILEVTTDDEEASGIVSGGLLADTALYANPEVDGVKTAYYQKSSDNYALNIEGSSTITGSTGTVYTITAETEIENESDGTTRYDNHIFLQPTLKAGDELTVVFSGTFEIGKKYMICADDPFYFENGVGDTIESIESTAANSNNNFVFIGDEADKDTTAPEVKVTGENPVTVELGDTYSDAGATATDDSGPVTVETTGTVDTTTVGVYIITYTSTDPSGNIGTATRVVNVVDTTAPVVTVTGTNPVTIELGGTYTDDGATATDLSGDVTVVTTGTVDTNVLGSYLITYTCTDDSGNLGTATRIVKVVDRTPPKVTVNGDNPATVELGGTYTDAGATATDLSGDVTVVTTGTVDTNTVGTYTVTYTSTDDSGNVGTATRTVIVEDTTAPVVTVTGDNPATVELGDTYNDAGATATDLSGDVTVVTTSNDVDTNTLGTYTVSYSSTDPSGNIGTATRTVNVVDTTAPEPPILNSIKPTNNVTPTINGKAEAGSIVDLFNGATLLGSEIADSAGNFSITCSPLVDGTYSITATATDQSGNTSAVSSELSITIDTTDPVLTDNLVDSIIEGQTSLGSISANEPVEWSVDNKDDIKLTFPNTPENTVIVSLKTGADLADGSYLYTITATDQSDNTSSVTKTVNVVPPDVIITNQDESIQNVMLRSSDNGVLSDIQEYKDTNGNDIVKDSIKEVVIQGSVTSIGNSAFYECKKLDSVTIGDSVTSIGMNAFFYCSELRDVTIPDSVTTIGNNAFSSCTSLQSVTIPDSVTSIGNGAFSACYKLKSMTIPDSVTSIGGAAFALSSELQSVKLPVNNEFKTINQDTFRRCYRLKSITIPNNVTTIGENAFKATPLQTVYLRGNNGLGLLQGQEENFYGKEDVDIVITDDLIITNTDNTTQYVMLRSRDNGILDILELYNDINGNEIRKETIKEVVIQGSITAIGELVFNDCTKMQNVTIGDSVRFIGYQAFYNCSALQSVIMGNNVEEMGIDIGSDQNVFYSYIFAYCENLETVIVSNKLRKSGIYDFRYCSNLKNIVLPDKWDIGYSFYGSGLKTVYVTPNNINIKLPRESFEIGENQVVGGKRGVKVISTYVLNVFTYPINGNVSDLVITLLDSNGDSVENINAINTTDRDGYYKLQFIPPPNTNGTYTVRATTGSVGRESSVTFDKSLNEFEKRVYVGYYSDFVGYCITEIKKLLTGQSIELSDDEITSLLSEYGVSLENEETTTLYELSMRSYIETVNSAAAVKSTTRKYTHKDTISAIKRAANTLINTEPIRTQIIELAKGYVDDRNDSNLAIKNTIVSKIRSNDIIALLIGSTANELETPLDINTISEVVNYGENVYSKMKGYLNTNPTSSNDDKNTYMSKVYSAVVTSLENNDSENGVPSTIPTDQEITEAQPIVLPSSVSLIEPEPEPEPEPQPDLTQEITVAPGWNWISFHLKQDDNSLNNIQLEDFEGNQVPLLFIKDQSTFAEYYDGTGWFGALTEIDVEKTFLFKNNSDSPGKLIVTGQKEDIVVIGLETGWNWIGYPRSESATLWTTTNTNGLFSNAQDGDFIKDQSNFATYYDGLGWFGALTTLEPGKGYFYKSVSDNILLFVNQNNEVLLQSQLHKSDKDGRTELFWAAHNGDIEKVEKLINSGENVNKQDNTKRTALHWASVNNYVEIVKMLVKSGATMNKDQDGYTALDWAKIKQHTEIEEILSNI